MGREDGAGSFAIIARPPAYTQLIPVGIPRHRIGGNTSAKLVSLSLIGGVQGTGLGRTSKMNGVREASHPKDTSGRNVSVPPSLQCRVDCQIPHELQQPSKRRIVGAFLNAAEGTGHRRASQDLREYSQLCVHAGVIEAGNNCAPLDLRQRIGENSALETRPLNLLVISILRGERENGSLRQAISFHHPAQGAYDKVHGSASYPALSRAAEHPPRARSYSCSASLRLQALSQPTTHPLRVHPPGPGWWASQTLGWQAHASDPQSARVRQEMGVRAVLILHHTPTAQRRPRVSCWARCCVSASGTLRVVHDRTPRASSPPLGVHLHRAADTDASSRVRHMRQSRPRRPPRHARVPTPRGARPRRTRAHTAAAAPAP
ncbi:hypothetical protein B0H17DRAFT_510709 [Mycena rosella]|uniref:Uncharacterized protein n=1 Tax=Mycena rosella TaxID=1033263 RepID=A0AAD7DJC8_MYCRO|nr:hypothetical protein B0H17DRAFT_510709 [Mycena rosella]